MTRLNDFFAGKRVLITGHTGFKGSWLTLWLRELGAEVTGYALAPDTTPSLFESANVSDGINHVVADIRDWDRLQDVMARAAPEVVFHLAAQPLVRRSYRDPKETFDINTGGTVAILEAIRNQPSVRAGVLITTDKVYENREWVWGYRENDRLGGHDPYAASKAAAELAIASYLKSFFSASGPRPRTGIASARAGNVLGGGDWAEDRIVPDAVRAVQAGSTLVVRNPRSIRPWQHVLEPLGAYLALAIKLAEVPDRFAGAWNFGPAHDDVMTVRELVEAFHIALGRGESRAPSATENGPHEAGLLKLTCDKASADLDWLPVKRTDWAVEATARWYRTVVFDNEPARRRCIADIGEYVNAARACDRWWSQ